MELHFYEIPKFRKKPIKELTRAERWLAYFASQLDEQEAEEMEATAIKDAFNAADIFMQNEEQRLAYVNREMAIMDYNADLRAFREEGREEGKSALIQSLLKAETPIEYIRKATGLTDEAILALKD